MAVTTIRDLLVRLGVKADTARVQKFDRALGAAKNTMLVALGASTALLGGLFALTSQTAKAGDAAAKTADRIGTTAEEYQELKFAAERAGAGAATIEKSFNKANKAMFDARNGSTVMAQSFKDIGFADLNELSTDATERFLQMAEGLKGIEDQATRSAIAQNIFGRGGAALLPLFKDGREGIEELREEARKYNVVIGEDAARASEVFEDEMLNLKSVLTGLRNEIGVALLPAFQSIIVGLRQGGLAVLPYVKGLTQFLDRTIGLRNALFGLVGIITTLSVALGSLAFLALVGGAIPAITALVGGVAAAAAALGLGMLPFLLLTAAAVASFAVALIPLIASLALVGLVVEDLVVFFNGGNSALGSFLDTFLEAPGAIGGTLRLLRSLGRLFFALNDLVTAFDDAVRRALLGALQLVFDQMVALDAQMGGLVARFLELTGAGEAIRDFFQGTGEEIEKTAGFIDQLVTLLNILSFRLDGFDLDFAGVSIPSSAGLLGGPGPGNVSNTTNNVNVSGAAQINTAATAGDALSAFENMSGNLLRQAQDAVFSTEE